MFTLWLKSTSLGETQLTINGHSALNLMRPHLFLVPRYSTIIADSVAFFLRSTDHQVIHESTFRESTNSFACVYIIF